MTDSISSVMVSKELERSRNLGAMDTFLEWGGDPGSCWTARNGLFSPAATLAAEAWERWRGGELGGENSVGGGDPWKIRGGEMGGGEDSMLKGGITSLAGNSRF